MCRNFPKLLTAPAEALAAAKRKPSYGDALGTLIVDGIVAAVAVAVFMTQVGGLADLGARLGQGMGMAVISAFILVLIGGLFFALLVKIVVNTLGGKGDYLHGLTLAAYGIAAPVVGALVTAIFFRIPVFGAIAGFVAMSIALALGVSTIYRGIKELFSTDLVTALIAFSILTLCFMTAIMLLMPMLGLSGVTSLGGLA